MSLDLLQAAEARLPLWADGPLEFGRHWVLPYLHGAHPCRLLRGSARDGSPASVLVVGTTGKLDHATLGPGFFAEPPEEVICAPVHGTGLLAWLAAELDRHDLVLARTWQLFAREADGSFLTLPAQPDMRLPADAPDRVLAMATPTIRRFVRMAERHGFELARTTDEASFQRFYWEFYRPFVEARHGAGTVLHPPSILRRRLRRGALTWASLGGEPLFGSASETGGGVLRELVNGTADGRTDELARLAAYAVRLEHMRVSHAGGLRWLNLGGVAPWLSDGVARHKRAWGAELIDRQGNHRTLLVGWRRWTPAIARFLAAFPLVVRRPWGFGAVLAATGETPQPDVALKCGRSLAPRGITRMTVLDASGAAALLWSERHGARRIVLAQPPSSAQAVELIDQGIGSA
ncbi:MAG: hypothetical protein AB7I59_19655 [Geminicoccaceae bacterium]